MRPVITDGRSTEIPSHIPCLQCCPSEGEWSSKKHETLLTTSLNHTNKELLVEMLQKENTDERWHSFLFWELSTAGILVFPTNVALGCSSSESIKKISFSVSRYTKCITGSRNMFESKLSYLAAGAKSFQTLGLLTGTC